MKKVPKRALLVLLVAIASYAATAQAQLNIVNKSVLTRIFRIRYGENFGSSFAIEVDSRQYLITAGHVVPGIKDGDSVELEASEAEWKPYKVQAVIRPSDASIDVVALALPSLIVPPASIIPTFAGALYGQDVYFLGFPYNLATFVNGWSPIPFVRKGIWSASSGYLIYIDGINNPGFSGGPVLFEDYNTHQLKFGGVVQGYEGDYQPVMRAPEHDTRPIDKIPRSQLEKTGEFVPENAAIVRAYSINPIVEAIRKKPVGPETKQ